MASSLNMPFKSRANSLLYESMHFQRKKSSIKNKRRRKKIRLKFLHIFLFFLIMGGTFYSIQKLLIFMMSWDYLNIKEIKISCSSPKVKKDIEHSLEGKKSENILLVDIVRLQQSLEAHRWVKEAHIRKIFPASLSIEIRQRKPIAVLKKQNLYLIDEEGHHIERIHATENQDFPLLIDSNNFRNHGEEKLKMAWDCLKDLSPSESQRIRALDLTYHNWVTLYPKDKEVRVILDHRHFAQRFRFFYEHYDELKADFGPLEYIDLRFQNRLYIKPQKISSSIIPNPKKEAL
jgi:cell division protein FtsQ